MTDAWSDWLLLRRQGGSELQADQRDELMRYRDGVLGGAALRPNDVLLDVGCGDGLIGFGAFEALRGALRVVFSDVSSKLLRLCEERAEAMGVSDRSSYVQASAEDLAGVGDESVDAVTTRSVLIYASRKRDAFAEFFRVLRPGGRLSIFEPINRRMFPEPPGMFWGWDVSAVAGLRDRVVAEIERRCGPDLRPMMDFDENDLVRLAEDAGFEEVELILQVSVTRPHPRDWEQVLHSSPNPLSPTLLEAVDGALESTEASLFLSALRGSVEAGVGQNRLAVAYLRARKG
ncbi:MAG: methyltransferase domain-containing protein [Candidatus Dormibacteraeota bacterium]|uniref:Methyltransferase domain-containing protein n=1 Tax=Candidatus Amunia macphersoniae TaxID=3127014 RepID=A0A934NH69_9BACT|nr:methyltransferase domain-containing protein [Candidatus Dormibacteraeota bacterium]